MEVNCCEYYSHITGEAILKLAVLSVMEQGLKALNIRAVAQKCGISIGAVYHYFPRESADLIGGAGNLAASLPYGK